MTLNIEEFITQCNSRRKNSNFSIIAEFNNLSLGKQLEVIQSIKSTSLARPAVPGQVLENLSPAQVMAQTLQTILGSAIDLDMSQTIDMGCTGELKVGLNRRTFFYDQYSRKTIPIRNENGTILLNYGNKDYQPTITRGDGFTTLEFEIPSIREEFLNGLKRAYGSRLADGNEISMTEMIDQGMIHEVAKKFNPRSTHFSFAEKFKLCSFFDEQTSFLHLIASKMNLDQFNNFTKDIPESYVNLMNGDGKTADEIRTNIAATRTTINDGAIDTHQDSIHTTIDQSFVRLANRFNYGIQVVEKAIFISVNHIQVKKKTKNTIAEIRREIAKIIAYDNIQLYEHTAHLLDGVEAFLDIDSEQMHKILSFRRFQVETAAALLEDVVQRGLLGNDYVDITVNDQNENGLTVKEMIALSYKATKDLGKIIVGSRLNETGQLVKVKFSELENIEEQNIFKKRIWFKFIDTLYTIRRGYNIDYGTDKPELYEYNSSRIDENVCAGGAINKLAYYLNVFHQDVDVKIVNAETLKLRINIEVPEIINQIVAESLPEERMRVGGWLADWKSSNKIPPELRVKVHDRLKVNLANPDHPIVKEYREFFPINAAGDPIISYAKKALTTCSYPRDKITEIPIGMDAFMLHINSGKNPHKLPKYMRSSDGGHKLVIVEMLKAHPEIMSELLENSYDFRRYYLLKNDNMVHVVVDYIEHHDKSLLNKPKALEKAMDYVHNDPQKFKEFFASLETSVFISRCSKPIIAAIVAAPTRCFNITKAIPENKIFYFVGAIKGAMIATINNHRESHDQRWENANKILQAVPIGYQATIIREVSIEFSNKSERKRLNDMLPEDQRSATQKKVNKGSWVDAVGGEKKRKMGHSYADIVKSNVANEQTRL